MQYDNSDGKKIQMSREYAPLSETHQNKLNFSKKTIFHEEVFLDMYISALITLLKNRGKPEFFLNKSHEKFVHKLFFLEKLNIFFLKMLRWTSKKQLCQPCKSVSSSLRRNFARSPKSF